MYNFSKLPNGGKLYQYPTSNCQLPLGCSENTYLKNLNILNDRRILIWGSERLHSNIAVNAGEVKILDGRKSYQGFEWKPQKFVWSLGNSAYFEDEGYFISRWMTIEKPGSFAKPLVFDVIELHNKGFKGIRYENSTGSKLILGCHR